MNPKVVVLLVVAALFIGLLVGTGIGIVGASMFHRMKYRHDPYHDFVTEVAVARPAIEEKPLVVELPAGYRAVAIKVGQDLEAGFIAPGSKVDVLQQRAVPERRLETTTIVQDVQVLALDQNGNVTLVTLALTPEQSENITKAQNEGTLSLVLRAIPR
ncbi:MAG: hypothetical protein JNM56_07465 [Planctomycetia bacterium]|nr:hypothetical protein [Planctomycetia bacterium]